MASILGHVDVQAILQTSVVPQTTFGLEIFLSDDDQVPVDQRFSLTTKDSFDDFDSASDPYKFANVYFAQKRTPAELMIGRWIRTASNVYWVAGPDYESDFAVWKAVTDGSFTVKDNSTPTPLEDDISGCDFSGITELAGILTVLNAKLAALTPNITGLDSAVFEFDFLNRLILKHSQTGSAAKLLQIIPTDPPVGTDLAAGFFDNSNGFAVAGVDAEEPSDALSAISEISAVGDSYYNIALDRAASDDQMVETASYVEAKTKLIDLVVTSAGAKASGTTTDVGYRCKALGLKKTMVIYTEHDDQYPDAATAGAVLPATEGTTNWAYEVLSLVSESGATKPLTATEKAVLRDKNYNYLEALGSNIFMYDGITSGDVEKRIMLGRDWFEARIAEDLFTDLLNQPLRGFTNETIAFVVGVVKTYGTEAIDRGIGVNTPERPFVINAPDADDFTTAQRASHRMELGSSNDPFFVLPLNSAVNDYTLIGVWNI